MKFLFIIIIFFLQNADAGPLGKKEVVEILKSSGYRWRQIATQSQDADAKLSQAESAFSPFVNLSARQMVAKINPMQYGITPPDNLDWLAIGSIGLQGGISLYDSASKALIDAAKANVKLQSLNEQHLKNELTLLSLLQLLNLQKIKRQREVVGSNLERDLKILAAAKKKYATGFGVGLDVERAEGLVAHQKFKQLEIETESIKACQDLASTLGKQDLQCEVEDLKVSLVDEDQLQKTGAGYLPEKSDIKASEITVTAAEALKAKAEKESNPKVVLFGETSFVGTSIISGPQHAPTGILGIQVTLPILSGGLHSGKVQEQAVKVSLANLQHEQLSLEAYNQLKVAVAQLKNARAAIGLSQRQIDVSTKELNFAEKKMGTGSIGSLELNSAQINLASANELNVQVQFAYEAAKLNYCRIIGSADSCIQGLETLK